jgi:hypothetical protein
MSPIILNKIFLYFTNFYFVVAFKNAVRVWGGYAKIQEGPVILLKSIELFLLNSTPQA